MDVIANPHDAFFRESFSRREVAADFLQNHLPPALLAQLDLNSLELDKDSYVSPDLRQSYSDLVYRLRFNAGGPLFLYLLFEHKSHPDRWVALQLLRYFVFQGEAYRKQHPGARYLPPVYPLVIYHGRQRWTGPLDLHALVQPLPPEMTAMVPQFHYALQDLSPYSDTEIKGQILSRLAQQALRWIHSDEPLSRLSELIGLIQRVQSRETALQVLESLIRYYTQGTGKVDEDAVRRLLEQTTNGDPIMQTFIDRYIQQGREQGIQQGERLGEARMLLRQAEAKFGSLDRDVRQRILDADSESLLLWSGRILRADSLESVFGD